MNARILQYLVGFLLGFYYATLIYPYCLFLLMKPTIVSLFITTHTVFVANGAGFWGVVSSFFICCRDGENASLRSVT